MGSSKLIYIVDDNQSYNTVTEATVKNCGIPVDVQFFLTPESALEALASSASTGSGFPDIVLVDVVLPGMDGYEFVVEYQSRGYADKFPNTRLYLQSSSDFQSHSLSGVEGYFFKPLVRQDYIDLLE